MGTQSPPQPAAPRNRGRKPIFESGLRQHLHYYKDVSKYAYVDVYRILKLFDVQDPALQHAIKKLLVAGGRGGGKDIRQDVQEAIDTLQRWREMQDEDRGPIEIPNS